MTTNTRNQHGGRRRGAGTKPIWGSPAVSVTIQLPAEVVKAIDSLRDGSRSRYIADIVIPAVERRAKIERRARRRAAKNK